MYNVGARSWITDGGGGRGREREYAGGEPESEWGEQAGQAGHLGDVWEVDQAREDPGGHRAQQGDAAQTEE